MKKRNIFKILFLLNLIFNKNITKKEIMDEFEKINIQVSPNSITLYVKKLIKYGFKIKILKDENFPKKNVYAIEKPFIPLELTKKQLNLLYEIKMLIIAQKDFRYIETLYDLFLNLSRFIPDEEQKNSFMDFGYFSTINWELTKSLKKYCENKSIVKLDYILPSGGNKIIEYQLNSLELGDLSQRLYLTGYLKDAKDFFRLPVDRIFRVKKILIEKPKEIKALVRETFKYKILKENIEYIELKENEKIIEEDENFITIQAEIYDDFKTIQRLMYFCPDLYYISSKRIKNLLIDKLKKTKELYD